MSIEIFIEPGQTYTWDEFKQAKPAFSMALDGLVDDHTMRDPIGPYANFDHHSHADRYSTRSTSEQVHMEINMGLFQTFQKGGMPTANIFINDVDEDTCLASWLLLNHERIVNHAEPSINRLVYCEDKLDVTGGAYPFGDTSMRRKMAWIFEPYNTARCSGCIKDMNATTLKSILEAVWYRLDAYSINNGQELSLESHYELIGGGEHWSLVRETGPASRMAMFNNNITSYVVLVGMKNDKYIYTIGRKSVWIPFDLDNFYKVLNDNDPVVEGENKWGGSNTIGGSPRLTGSALAPEDIERLINDARYGSIN